MRTRGRTLLAVLALSLAAKLLLWGWVAARDPARFLEPDSKTYDDSARALLETGSFAVSPEHPDVPQTMRTPGYPLFLAAAYRMLGREPGAAVLLQIALSLATIALAWRLAAALWDPGVARLAAALLALDIVSFSHALLLMTETLFALCLLLVAAAAIRVAGGAPGRGAPAALGAALAAATLVRPLAYYLIVPLLAVLLLWGRFGLLWPRRRLLATAGWVALPFALAVGAWQARNGMRAANPEYCQIEGVNALFYRAAGIVALRDGVSLEQAQRRIAPEGYVALLTRAMLHPEERLSARGRAEFLRLARRHPFLWLGSAGRGGIRMMAGTGDDALGRLLGLPEEGHGPLGDLGRLPRAAYIGKWLGRHPLRFGLFLFASAFLLCLYAGSALWAWSALRSPPASMPGTPEHEGVRRGRGAHLCLWAILIYVVAISAGPEAYYRFRLPIMPILCLYGAAGLRAALARQNRASLGRRESN